jgi:hypothetical protein
MNFKLNPAGQLGAGAKLSIFEKKLFITTCAGTEMRGRGAADE